MAHGNFNEELVRGCAGMAVGALIAILTFANLFVLIMRGCSV